MHVIVDCLRVDFQIDSGESADCAERGSKHESTVGDTVVKPARAHAIDRKYRRTVAAVQDRESEATRERRDYGCALADIALRQGLRNAIALRRCSKVNI